jgi:hypothetical protein
MLDIYMAEIYKPREKIAIASSFEGIVNDGAPECAFVSFNAYHYQDPRAFFGRKMTAAEFNNEYRKTLIVKAFLALRPIVEVAEDYRTVLDVLARYPNSIMRPLSINPNNTETYEMAAAEFNRIKNETQKERDEFGKSKESLFYKERKALQEANYDEWLNTQKPFDDTLPQFRYLVDTQIWDGNTPVSGFFPRFATSKDEASTHALCVFYTKVRKLDPSDVEGKKCIIPRDGIIGMETVPSRDKIEQLKVIADRLEVPRSQVWRMNDRYDPKQQEQLNKAGFVYQFFLPGYATPQEIETAKKDGLVRVLDRNLFASQLADHAHEWGF